MATTKKTTTKLAFDTLETRAMMSVSAVEFEAGVVSITLTLETLYALGGDMGWGAV